MKSFRKPPKLNLNYNDTNRTFRQFNQEGRVKTHRNFHKHRIKYSGRKSKRSLLLGKIQGS